MPKIRALILIGAIVTMIGLGSYLYLKIRGGLRLCREEPFYIPFECEEPIDDPTRAQMKIAGNIIEVKFNEKATPEIIKEIATELGGELTKHGCQPVGSEDYSPHQELWIVFPEAKTYSELQETIQQLRHNPYVEYAGLKDVIMVGPFLCS